MSECELFWVGGGECGCMGHYFGWVAGGWGIILSGWGVRKYFGWVGVGGDEWG